MPENYEERVFRQLLPGAIRNCDDIASALAYEREYRRSKESPWFAEAASGYVRAFWFSRRSEPLTRENRGRIHAENFLGRVKRESLAPEETSWAKAVFAEEGFADYRDKTRDALKNRRRYRKETEREEAKTDELILTLWFPALLWLMDDKAVPFAIRAIRNREGLTPLKDFEISAKGYQTARLRLHSIGLRSWHDFLSNPPVLEICSQTGRIVFAQTSQLPFAFGE